MNDLTREKIEQDALLDALLEEMTDEVRAEHQRLVDESEASN